MIKTISSLEREKGSDLFNFWVINVLNRNLISELKQCQITLIPIIQFLGENLVKFQLRNLLCKNNKNNDYLELVFVVMLIIDNIITCSRKDHKIILAA